MRSTLRATTMADVGRSSGDHPRAPRFNLRIPIRYRASGETAWGEGTTENISRSGVLFRAQRLLKEGTSVDMSFVLPVEMTDGTHAEVSCRGHIVRIQPDLGARAGLAATISNYHFGRGRDKPGP